MRIVFKNVRCHLNAQSSDVRLYVLCASLNRLEYLVQLGYFHELATDFLIFGQNTG